MLYISRCIGACNYGVVDTDDNTEEVVSFDDLMKIVDLGIEVKGTVVEKQYVEGLGMVPELIEAYPYRVQEPSSTPLVKLRVLYGVDLHLRDNIITMICRDDRLLPDGFRLALSKYGRILGDNFLFDPSFGLHKKTLILEFDDNLILMEDSLHFSAQAHVAIDITKVTDETVVSAVYKEYIHHSAGLAIEKFIIDVPDRQNYWQVLGFLKGLVSPSVPECLPSSMRRLTAEYRPELARMAKYTASICPVKTADSALGSKYVDYLSIVSKYLDGKLKSFDEMLSINPEIIMTSICSLTTYNASGVGAIARYLLYLDPPEDIKRLYEIIFRQFSDWVKAQYERL